MWSWRRDLNPRPSDYKSDALPAELRQPLPTGEPPSESLKPYRPNALDTLPLSTYCGTKIKVSILRVAEQTVRR
jgi:hypothetical protein